MAKTLFSSAGFYTIQESRECRFDFSAKKEYLRKIIFVQTSRSSSEKRGEEIYRYVKTEAEKNFIKKAGGKWIRYREGCIKNIAIYEHVDSRDFVTGWYRTVEKVRNQEGTYTSWVRYFRRVGS